MMPIKRYPIINTNIFECYVSIFNDLIIKLWCNIQKKY